MNSFIIKKFIKNYEDTDSPSVRASYGRVSGIFGILGNFFLFLAKLIIGSLSGSVSITADAINNLSDASSSLITLAGFKLASKPADEKHPYGHARIEYFSALIVSVLILVIGVELGKSSIEKILHPEAVEFSLALVLVLVLSMAVKFWMGGTLKEMGTRIHSSALIASGTDSRNDVISTGVVLLSCIVGKITGLRIDGYMGLLVAILILKSGIDIAKETLDPLLGAAPDPDLMQKVTDDLMAEPLVLGIHDMMIHDYGPGRSIGSVHAEIDCKTDVMEAHEAIDDLEKLCLEKHKVLMTIHYDPIVTDDEELNRMKEKANRIIQEINPELLLHDFRMVRGKGHTNLIFDLVIPFSLSKEKDTLKDDIQKRLQEGEEMTYYAVIEFDLKSFNQAKTEPQ